tara:strand:+ start:717 stop:1892 length:1176 start_codon:yes stop_codon:yes gene_type:complete
MAKGIPIRLVQENGNLIELDATNMVLSTTRKVGGAALPWTGSRRIGMDWNVNSAMINIQGIIADDRVGTSAAPHSASINFGRLEAIRLTFTDDTELHLPFATSTNIPQLLGIELQLQSFTAVNASQFDSIPFTNNGSGSTAYHATAGAGSTPTVLVHNSSTPEDIATAVAAYINAQLSSKYTAQVVEGLKADDGTNLVSANCVVSISMTTNGRDTATRRITPRFKKVGTASDASTGSYFKEPVFTRFSSGTDSIIKSAGDKVQDLYGIINNSTRRGTIGKLTGRIGSRNRVKGSELQDYIVGIQIPYNSTLKAEGGEKYVARNFFMPTGFYYGKEKTSENNDHPASVEFDMEKELTGIQGAVQKFDITYDAGESVYNFNMIFAPIDNMILS